MGPVLRFLAVVERHLRLPVGYDGLSLYHSTPDGREVGSRLWHRDRGDRRMVKVCVYLTDVDEETGPFQTVLPADSSRLCPPDRFTYPIFRHAARVGGANKWFVSHTGRAGTVVLADTARYFHRGGRCGRSRPGCPTASGTPYRGRFV